MCVTDPDVGVPTTTQPQHLTGRISRSLYSNAADGSSEKKKECYLMRCSWRILGKVNGNPAAAVGFRFDKICKYPTASVGTREKWASWKKKKERKKVWSASLGAVIHVVVAKKEGHTDRWHHRHHHFLEGVNGSARRCGIHVSWLYISSFLRSLFLF